MGQAQRQLALAGVALMVGAGLALYGLATQRAGEAKKLAEATQRRPFLLPSDAVRGLRLVRGGAALTAERHDGTWRIVAPVHDLGDALALDGVLATVNGLEVLRTFAASDAPPPASVELDPPRLAITITLGNGTQGLWLGKRSAFDGRVFARLGPDPAVAPIVLVDGNASLGLDKGLMELRERRLCPLEMSTLTTLRVRFAAASDAAVSFAAHRASDSAQHTGAAWVLDEPVRGAGDNDTFDGLLQALGGARYDAIVEEQPTSRPARDGRDAPAYEVRASGPDGECQVSVTEQRDAAGQLVLRARRAGAAAITTAPPHWREGLARSLFDLRDQRLFTFAVGAVQRVRLQLPGGKLLVVEREAHDGGATWSMLAPRPGRARSWRVAALVDLLAGLKQRQTPAAGPPAPAAAEELGPEVTLLDAEGRILARLRQHGGVGELARVEVGMEAAVHWVDRARVEELPRSADDLLVAGEDANTPGTDAPAPSP